MLVAVFGSLAAAAIPLVLAVFTVAVTMGVVYALSTMTTMSVFVAPTVSMFGIALAIDYSLFILMRFREELRSGRDQQQATDAAMATSGLAVVLSGLTVVASLTGIYLINTPVLRSMATGAILSVVFAVLTSTTMTPAVLATFGRQVARRSALLHWSRRGEATSRDSGLAGWAWSCVGRGRRRQRPRRCCSSSRRRRSPWCSATACKGSSRRPTRFAAGWQPLPRPWARER